MYQSGREGDEAKKRKSPAKSGRVGIYVFMPNITTNHAIISLYCYPHKVCNFHM